MGRKRKVRNQQEGGDYREPTKLLVFFPRACTHKVNVRAKSGLSRLW